MSTLFLDVETDGLLLDLNRIWCVVIASRDSDAVIYADQPGFRPIREAVDMLRNANKIVGHNITGFDAHVINKFYPNTIRMEQCIDTLVMSRVLNPEREGGHSLEAWGEYLHCPKGSFTDFTAFSVAMTEYCVQDVLVLKKIHDRIRQIMKNDDKIKWFASFRLETNVSWIVTLQYIHGFKLNLRKTVELTGTLRQEQRDLVDQLQKMADFKPMFVPDSGEWCFETCTWIKTNECYPKRDSKRINYTKGIPFATQVLEPSQQGAYKTHYIKEAPFVKIVTQVFNPGSRQQIAYRLSRFCTWSPDKRTKKDNVRIDEDILNDLPYASAKILARYFRIIKLLAQVSDGDHSWLKSEKKERVHGSINTIGARTHRMSHHSPNMAQVDKKDLRMREVWLPDTGHVLVGCDASSLELRMLAHYLAAYDGGVYAERVVHGTSSEGTDVHTITQKALGLASRDVAKTITYATLYGSGYAGLGRKMLADVNIANGKVKDPVTLGKKARQDFMGAITGFDELLTFAQDQHNSLSYLVSLDGRKVHSKSAHSALNTLLQSAGAIVCKKALEIFHLEHMTNNKWHGIVEYCANVHDEVQLSTPPQIADVVGKAFVNAIRQAGVALGVQCQLDGEYHVGKNWSQTH